ncbi:MAG: Hypoxanthine-guanine phosphoribosyltransferase, partial [uncultured Frankineae bacterium]
DRCRQSGRPARDRVRGDERAGHLRARARARRPGRRRLRRPRDPARRRAQGRGHVHGRPGSRAADAGVDGVHGRVLLRLVHLLQRGRADPQGPRPGDRRQARARRRGHHRLRAHAVVAAAQHALARPGLCRGRRAHAQARRREDRGPGQVRRLRHRQRVRRRVRPGLRRALPRPAVRRPAQARGVHRL